MKVERFEDLIAWQKARQLTKAIYEITKNSEFSRDWGLRDQMQRAAVSVMSNIAEGFERRGRVEFRRFLIIARASCAELRSQLYVAYDVGYIQTSDFERLNKASNEVSRIIAGLAASLRSDPH